jgi:hypothetical protein
MSQTILILKGEQCDDITCISTDNLYKTGQRKEDGKKYNLYKYNGTAFTVESTSPFCDAQANGKLAQVKFIQAELSKTVSIFNEKTKMDEDTIIQVPTLEFDSSVTMEMRLNRAMFNAKESALSSFTTQTDLSENSLKEIMSFSF